MQQFNNLEWLKLFQCTYEKKLIKNEKLNSITFTAKEKSRKRLYRSLNEKFANELGWETYNYEIRTPDGEETVFVAYNPKAFPVEEVVNPPQIKFSNSNTSTSRQEFFML